MAEFGLVTERWGSDDELLYKEALYRLWRYKSLPSKLKSGQIFHSSDQVHCGCLVLCRDTIAVLHPNDLHKTHSLVCSILVEAVEAVEREDVKAFENFHFYGCAKANLSDREDGCPLSNVPSSHHTVDKTPARPSPIMTLELMIGNSNVSAVNVKACT